MGVVNIGDVPEIGGPDVKFEPFSDFVLIEPIKRSQTAGGIALPDDTSQDETRLGKVLRVGPGVRDHISGNLIPMTAAAGDTVFLMLAGQPAELVIGRKTYLICRVRDLIGKVPQ